ncbi:MAG: response regulator transcription factor [Bacteroidetes bacterium]|nr:response regulator transcription factor [Bacteroidota bacterium]
MHLLVVEDEQTLLQSILEYFAQEDFICEGVVNYASAVNKIEDSVYDCIVLDLNLPDGNGLRLLQYLRKLKKDDCVIIISARNSLKDKIAGLDLGADDYLTKPFHLSELNARIKALLRRRSQHTSDILIAGIFFIDLAARTATCDGQKLSLTKGEFDLLVYLVNNKNRVVSRQAIAEHIYGDQSDNIPSFDFVYSQIKNLKRKLKEKGHDDLIQSVYGLGYKLSL